MNLNSEEKKLNYVAWHKTAKFALGLQIIDEKQLGPAE